MASYEIFGIVVRAIGLVLSIAAFVVSFVAVALPGLLFYTVPALLIGLWLLRGASVVVSFAYPEEQRI